MVFRGAAKKSLRFVLAFLLVLILSVAAFAADSFKTTVRVNFRRGPSTDAAIIKTLDQGLTVQVDDYDPAGWSKATVNGTHGYIKSEYLNPVAPSTSGGEASKTAQTATYWTTGRVNLRSGPSTNHGVIKVLDTGTKVEVSSYDPAGWSKLTAGGTAGYVKSEYLRGTAATGGTTAVGGRKVELTPWSEAKKIFKTYTPAEITDVRTGSVYFVQSFSNGNHADVEPLTKADTEIMFKTFGKKWSWAVRPVWVSINGHTMAASINGMPHGGGTIASNGMNGQVCIHFLGSLTHNGNKSFERTHQNGVMEAYNASK